MDAAAAEAAAVAAAAAAAAASSSHRSTPSRKRKHDPDAEAGTPADGAIDPNEPLYCFCQQVSFGEMVACDSNEQVRGLRPRTGRGLRPGPGRGLRPGPGRGLRPGPGRGLRPGPGRGLRPGPGPGPGLRARTKACSLTAYLTRIVCLGPPRVTVSVPVVPLSVCGSHHATQGQVVLHRVHRQAPQAPGQLAVTIFLLPVNFCEYDRFRRVGGSGRLGWSWTFQAPLACVLAPAFLREFSPLPAFLREFSPLARVLAREFCPFPVFPFFSPSPF